NPQLTDDTPCERAGRAGSAAQFARPARSGAGRSGDRAAGHDDTVRRCAWRGAGGCWRGGRSAGGSAASEVRAVDARCDVVRAGGGGAEEEAVGTRGGGVV